jgi:hypothetical protein
MTMDKNREQLHHEAFEWMRQYIKEGATPKERAERGRWIMDMLLGKVEPQMNEEWDTLEELRRE